MAMAKLKDLKFEGINDTHNVAQFKPATSQIAII
jgi:hypothetical protein